MSGAPSPWTLVAGGALGLLGVAAGAFGAHALSGKVSARDLEIWQTAAHYQQVHAVVLVVLGLATRDGVAARWAAALMVLGIAIFSGTLYAMVLGGPRMLGAITPVGGLCLMGGWAAIALEGIARLRT